MFRSYDKSSGVSLRSSKVKMPPSVGQKKAKIIEQCLEDLHVCKLPFKDNAYPDILAHLFAMQLCIRCQRNRLPLNIMNYVMRYSYCLI